jgi:PAS domain S-box-containing protein
MQTLLSHPEMESIAIKAIVDIVQQPPSRSMIQNEQHLHGLLNRLPAAIYLTDARGRITFYNDAAADLWGCRPRLNSDQWCGSWRLYRPDGTPLPHDQCPMAVALRERRAIVGEEAVAQRPDGTRVSFVAYPSPLRDSSGALVGAINMLVDITERRRAEQFRLRLASIVESSDDAIVSKDLNGIIATWNRGAERLFGYSADDMIGKPIAVLIPPECQGEEPLILERIKRGERIDHYETIRRRKDGSLIEISLTVSPVRDADGRIVGASKIARDISEHKRKERHIALLAREVDHRSKNLLALVRAAVRLTEADNAEELKVAIEGRLEALSNAHALLTQSRWECADLRELISEELSPYCRQGDQRAQIVGTNVALEPMAAQSIAIVLHELATNAVKYGALSVPTGHVHVEWWHPLEGGLIMRWSEAGGPAVEPPTRRGFGTNVTNRLVRGQLRGEVRFHWRVEGLVCEIHIPKDTASGTAFVKCERPTTPSGKTEADEHLVAESLPEAMA